MDEYQGKPKFEPPKSNNNKILLLVIPLFSCGISSVAGIILGQIGNLINRSMGEFGKCMTIPSFIVLFIVTFGLSFFSNKLIRKWLSGLTK